MTQQQTHHPHLYRYNETTTKIDVTFIKGKDIPVVVTDDNERKLYNKNL